MTKIYYRSIFISDVHLGTRNCKASYLLDFLRSTQSEYLYLVGDIFDLIAMKKQVHWTATQTSIVQQIFRKARQETKVIFIPGNHDNWFRSFQGMNIKEIRIERDTTHTTLDGKRFFVSHGDEFDVLVKHSRVMYIIGDLGYAMLLRINHLTNTVRKYLNLPYWSFSKYIKSHVKKANEFVEGYKQAAVNRATKEGYDGYVCGHIHKSGISHSEGVLYCNTGDWVEHCTALVEDETGSLQILHWSDHAKVEVINRGTEVIHSDMPLLIPTKA